MKIFDCIKDIRKVKLSEHEILLKLRKIEDSNIILTDEKEHLQEGGRHYSIVVKTGKSVDPEYVKENTVILLVKGNRLEVFDFKGNQYAIVPVSLVSMCTELDNFSVAGKMTAKVTKNKSNEK